MNKVARIISFVSIGVPENISILLASPIEYFLNTNIILVEGDVRRMYE
ncbi:MAG: hypothetical protein ACREA4_06115 [Nitrososphaera sp.]